MYIKKKLIANFEIFETNKYIYRMFISMLLTIRAWKYMVKVIVKGKPRFS